MDDRGKPTASADEADDNLATYLNEHLLGSEGGVRAFKAAQRTWEGTPHAATLAELARDVERDRRDLARMIQRLGYRQQAWKRALTGVVRAVGKLNPVNAMRRRDTSMTQTELDVLTGLVRVKLAMWDALIELADDDSRHDRALLVALKSRAEHQIDELQRISLATVRERFPAGRSGLERPQSEHSRSKPSPAQPSPAGRT